MSIERKYLAHYIDASFGTAAANWVRLGKDLEELAIEFNPEEETKRNILGENSTRISGYEVSYSVDTFYAEPGDALWSKLLAIADARSTGNSCNTKVLDVLITPTVSQGTTTYTVTSAYTEDAIILVQSLGGDTTGVQIPFEVRYNGNRTDVKSNVTATGGVIDVTGVSNGYSSN